MKKSTKISITTESRELFILHAGGHPRLRQFCPECGQESELLSLDEAVTLTGQGARAVWCLMETNRVYALETASGHLRFCRDCLVRERWPSGESYV